jgi:hypothetical protein
MSDSGKVWDPEKGWVGGEAGNGNAASHLEAAFGARSEKRILTERANAWERWGRLILRTAAAAAAGGVFIIGGELVGSNNLTAWSPNDRKIWMAAVGLLSVAGTGFVTGILTMILAQLMHVRAKLAGE